MNRWSAPPNYGGSLVNTGTGNTAGATTLVFTLTGTVIPGTLYNIVVWWTGTGTISSIVSNLGHVITVDAQINSGLCGVAIASYYSLTTELPQITVTWNASVTARRFNVSPATDATGRRVSASVVNIASSTSLAMNGLPGGPNEYAITAWTLPINKTAGMTVTGMTERFDGPHGTVAHNYIATAISPDNLAVNGTASWATACAAVAAQARYSGIPVRGRSVGQSEATRYAGWR